MPPDTWTWSRNPTAETNLSDFEKGAVLVRFVDKANFGGDGKQAQVSMRLHHSEGDLAWLLKRLPPGKLYGPYEYKYKDGGVRRFFQLMYRGESLKEILIPFLESVSWAEIAPEVFARYQEMRRRYRV